MSDWAESDKAKALLGELDAAERASDCYAGWGWSDVSRSFGARCDEIESELDDLRSEAVNAFADAASEDRASDAWLDAWEESDNEAESVKDACQRARRLHMGDGLLRLAAAA